MKKEYLTPEIDLILLAMADIITSSTTDDVYDEDDSPTIEDPWNKN